MSPRIFLVALDPHRDWPPNNSAEAQHLVRANFFLSRLHFLFLQASQSQVFVKMRRLSPPPPPPSSSSSSLATHFSPTETDRSTPSTAAAVKRKHPGDSGSPETKSKRPQAAASRPTSPTTSWPHSSTPATSALPPALRRVVLAPPRRAASLADARYEYAENFERRVYGVPGDTDASDEKRGASGAETGGLPDVLQALVLDHLDFDTLDLVAREPGALTPGLRRRHAARLLACDSAACVRAYRRLAAYYFAIEARALSEAPDALRIRSLASASASASGLASGSASGSTSALFSSTSSLSPQERLAVLRWRTYGDPGAKSRRRLTSILRGGEPTDTSGRGSGIDTRAGTHAQASSGASTSSDTGEKEDQDWPSLSKPESPCMQLCLVDTAAVETLMLGYLASAAPGARKWELPAPTFPFLNLASAPSDSLTGDALAVSCHFRSVTELNLLDDDDDDDDNEGKEVGRGGGNDGGGGEGKTDEKSSSTADASLSPVASTSGNTYRLEISMQLPRGAAEYQGDGKWHLAPEYLRPGSPPPYAPRALGAFSRDLVVRVRRNGRKGKDNRDRRSGSTGDDRRSRPMGDVIDQSDGNVNVASNSHIAASVFSADATPAGLRALARVLIAIVSGFATVAYLQPSGFNVPLATLPVVRVQDARDHVRNVRRAFPNLPLFVLRGATGKRDRSSVRARQNGVSSVSVDRAFADLVEPGRVAIALVE